MDMKINSRSSVNTKYKPKKTYCFIFHYSSALDFQIPVALAVGCKSAKSLTFWLEINRPT